MYFPTHLKRIILISLCFTTLVLTSCNTSAQSETINGVEKKPSDVVRDYVAIAGSGEFDKLVAMIAANPGKNALNAEEGRKPSSSASGNGSSFTAIPDKAAEKEAYNVWILRDFPKSIRDEKLIIKEVVQESVEGDRARIHVLFGNDKRTDLLGWVFVMDRIDGKWVIRDITTPGDASN